MKVRYATIKKRAGNKPEYFWAVDQTTAPSFYIICSKFQD
jgi:hypothetical protein